MISVCLFSNTKRDVTHTYEVFILESSQQVKGVQGVIAKSA